MHKVTLELDNDLFHFYQLQGAKDDIRVEDAILPVLEAVMKKYNRLKKEKLT